MTKVAVVAGTPVDTRMGVEYIYRKAADTPGSDIEPVYLPVSSDCDAQMRFQYSDDIEKRGRIDELFDPLIEDGVTDFFIYCNSLSGAFDFDSYARQKDIRVYTPLHVYSAMAAKYSRVGVMAANNLSAYNIERTMLEANDDMYVIGMGNMELVSAIESGKDPADIVTGRGVTDLIRCFESCGCEAIILGCTHFPYFADEMSRFCEIPLIDPAEVMWDTMISALRSAL